MKHEHTDVKERSSERKRGTKKIGPKGTSGPESSIKLDGSGTNVT